MRQMRQAVLAALLVAGALSGCLAEEEAKPKSVLLSALDVDLDGDGQDDAIVVSLSGSADREFLRFDGDLQVDVEEIVPATDCLPEERRPAGSAELDVRADQFFRSSGRTFGPGSSGRFERSEHSNLWVYEEVLPAHLFPRVAEYELDLTLDVDGGERFTQTIRARTEEGGPLLRTIPRDATEQVQGIHMELSHDRPELHVYGHGGAFTYASNCPFDAEMEVRVTQEVWTPNGTVDEDRGSFRFDASYDAFGSIGGNYGLGIVQGIPPTVLQGGGSYRFGLKATLGDGRVLTAEDSGWV